MARSACWTYVTWYNGLSSGDWATWLPGRKVEPGSVGAFNRDRRFGHYETLEELGITCAEYSGERPAEEGFYSTAGGFTFEPKIAGNAVPGFAALGELDAGVKLTAKAAHACLLQLVKPTVKKVINQRQVQESVLAPRGYGTWTPASRPAARWPAAGRSPRSRSAQVAALSLPAMTTAPQSCGKRVRLLTPRQGYRSPVSPAARARWRSAQAARPSLWRERTARAGLPCGCGT